jgi:predicted transcriptional regulator
MYDAYLSHAQLKEYLIYLQHNGLVEYEKETQIFRITPKGRQFLDAYNKINELTAPSVHAKLKTISF